MQYDKNLQRKEAQKIYAQVSKGLELLSTNLKKGEQAVATLYTYEDSLNKILKQNLNKNSNILELGFGAGQSASLFLKEGFKYTGMDISESLVNFAKSKNKKFVKKKNCLILCR